jgi:hypothetical protein
VALMPAALPPAPAPRASLLYLHGHEDGHDLITSSALVDAAAEPTHAVAVVDMAGAVRDERRSPSPTYAQMRQNLPQEQHRMRLVTAPANLTAKQAAARLDTRVAHAALAMAPTHRIPALHQQATRPVSAQVAPTVTLQATPRPFTMTSVSVGALAIGPVSMATSLPTSSSGTSICVRPQSATFRCV